MSRKDPQLHCRDASPELLLHAATTAVHQAKHLVTYRDDDDQAGVLLELAEECNLMAAAGGGLVLMIYNPPHVEDGKLIPANWAITATVKGGRNGPGFGMGRAYVCPPDCECNHVAFRSQYKTLRFMSARSQRRKTRSG